MSRLSDLYKAMETLRKEGLPVNEDLEKKANELEEEMMKKNANEDIVMQSIYHMLKLKQYNYKDNVCNSKVPFRG